MSSEIILRYAGRTTNRCLWFRGKVVPNAAELERQVKRVLKGLGLPEWATHIHGVAYSCPPEENYSGGLVVAIRASLGRVNEGPLVAFLEQFEAEMNTIYGPGTFCGLNRRCVSDAQTEG